MSNIASRSVLPYETDMAVLNELPPRKIADEISTAIDMPAASSRSANREAVGGGVLSRATNTGALIKSVFGLGMSFLEVVSIILNAATPTVVVNFSQTVNMVLGYRNLASAVSVFWVSTGLNSIKSFPLNTPVYCPFQGKDFLVHTPAPGAGNDRIQVFGFIL